MLATHSLAEKIKDKSTDDPTQFLHVIDRFTRIKFKSVTKHWVLTALQGIKEAMATGPDKIPAKMLTDAAELISVPLALIFNKLFWNGVFPYKMESSSCDTDI